MFSSKWNTKIKISKAKHTFFFDLGLGKDFLDIRPKHDTSKKKIDKMNAIQIKKVLKYTVKKKVANWKKII